MAAARVSLPRRYSIALDASSSASNAGFGVPSTRSSPVWRPQ